MPAEPAELLNNAVLVKDFEFIARIVQLSKDKPGGFAALSSGVTTAMVNNVCEYTEDTLRNIDKLQPEKQKERLEVLLTLAENVGGETYPKVVKTKIIDKLHNINCDNKDYESKGR